MGKKGDIRGSKGSNNTRTNSNRIGKSIEKEKRQQLPLRIDSSVVSHTLSANNSSAGIVSGDQSPYHGYIFMCNGKTKTDCFKYRVFGLPAAKIDVLSKIHPKMKLFLFDFDLRLLYGIYLPASRGEMSLEPTAFGGRFSAQVRFQVYVDCLPLPESVFKPIMRDNYQGPKFRQELNKEHVQNLMSLFRPATMSPSRAVVSLPTSISLEQSDEPPGFEEYSRPGLSDSRCQDLAGLHVLQAGLPRSSQHLQQLEKPPARIPLASVAKLQSLSLPTVRAQPQLQQHYSSEAHPAYFPALPEQELHNRYAALPRDDHVPIIERAQAHSNLSSHGRGHLSTKSLSAAYWISVANESLQKEMYPPHQSTTSTSMGVAVPSKNPPVEEKDTHIVLQHPPIENVDSSSAVGTAVMVQPPAEDCPMHLPSSSLVPGYWTSVASQDPNPIYSAPSQWQQVASAGLSTDNAPISVVRTGLAPGSYSVPETGVNQYVPGTGTTFDYDNYGSETGTDGVPAHAHYSTAYYSGTISVPTQAHDPAAAYYSANSSVPVQAGNVAAYYSAAACVPTQAGDHAPYYSGTTVIQAQAHDPSAAYYYTNTGDPAQAHDVAAYYVAPSGIPSQAHGPGAYYSPENSYGHTLLPPSSQAPAYWDPNLIGVGHFPQSILPSENNSTSVGGEHLTVLPSRSSC